MLAQLLFVTLSLLTLVSCQGSPSTDDLSDTQGLPGSVLRPRITPKDAETLLKISTRLTAIAGNKAISAVMMKQSVEKSLFSSILEVEGIPRSQIKDIFVQILDPRGAACGGASCSQIFGIKIDDIDSFLDDLRRKADASPSLKEESHLRARNILLDSLERTAQYGHQAKKRSYVLGGRTYTEEVFVAKTLPKNGLTSIVVERGVSWVEGGEVKKATYKGRVSYGLRDDVVEVHTLESNPEGKGSGSVVMKELAEEAKRLGKKTIHTLSTAHEALDFYHKLGFRPAKNDVSQLAKQNTDLYHSTLEAAKATPGFATKSLSEREAIVDKALGRFIATWEASTEIVLKNTDGIRYE